MKKVSVRQERVVIPTYEIAEYDKNPMFLEKRVYQGSSGRVYPHPVCEGVANTKTDKEYQAIYLENEYLLVMILPEIGGRIQRLYDKTNGYDAVYYNEVIKPALVGLAGPWISGGIEFNWPQHHRPSTFDPIDSAIEEHENGAVTVWVGETEKMFHTRGRAGFTVYPDRAYLEIRGRVYNPTERPQTFLWWANPAVAVNDFTQSVFPPDVHAVYDHGKRDVSAFPIAKGVYYKVDYAPGTDISRYKNIPVPTSYMANHSDFNFIGNYDYRKEAGLLHVADHHVSPGKKQWTWGNQDFGKAWDRNLTDENGPYIELMTGVFTDNQPDFTFLKPYEEKTFTQYFMPYKKVGAIKNASTEVVLNLDWEGSYLNCKVYSPVELGLASVELLNDGKILFQKETYLDPKNWFTENFEAGELRKDPLFDETKLTLRVCRAEKELLSFSPLPKAEDAVPDPAKELPAPGEIETTEKLFLAAVHLEQYRHATRSPKPYYLEGLKRDPEDIRLNNGYGKYLYQKGYYKESVIYFTQAVKSATWKNPNPFDCEPFFNLGLSLKALGKLDSAFDAFYKATWDGSQQDKAFYQLACIAAGRGCLKEALEYVEQSLVRGLHNLRARNLKTAILRLLGRKEEARTFALETQKIDILDGGCRYELYRLTGEKQILSELQGLLREDPQSYIDLSLNYRNAFLYDEASEALGLLKNSTYPMVHYYLFSYSGIKEELTAAETADSLYCFPNSLEDLEVLKGAVAAGGRYAAYYLGCLLYDKGRYEEAVALWESCEEAIELPTVHRNLSLAYYNQSRDSDRSKKEMEKAFSMDQSDARIFFELDQLYKTLNMGIIDRLTNMKAHKELLECRDDLYTEYITLLNLNGQYEKAYQAMGGHIFHPWEGGEGKITAQYRISLIQLSKQQKDDKKAMELLKQALYYPENLGEGKLIGCMDNDIFYELGLRASNQEQAEEYYKLAARGEGELNAAMYYNDQPPEMMYYAALALDKLGEKEESKNRLQKLVQYGTEHEKDQKEIDFFAVSLPDFLIFEGDLNRTNRVNCCYLAALGHLGLGEQTKARDFIDRGLSLESCHGGLNLLLMK